MELLSRFPVPVMNVLLFGLLQFRQVAISRNRLLDLVPVVLVSPNSLVVIRPMILV